MSVRTAPRPGGLRAAAASGLAALALAALAVGAVAPAADAHDYVVSTTPAGDATATSVPKVSTTFDDVVLDPQHDGSTTVLQVTDASGRHFETSCPTILDRTISVPTALGAAGTYTVTWRIVSADGHPVSGTWQFTYRPASDATAAAGSASSPCAVGRATGAATSGSTSDAVAGQGADVTGSSGVGVEVVAGVAGVAVLVVAAGVVLAVLRRRSDDTTED